jgi:hypothetical protein
MKNIFLTTILVIVLVFNVQDIRAQHYGKALGEVQVRLAMIVKSPTVMNISSCRLYMDIKK